METALTADNMTRSFVIPDQNKFFKLYMISNDKPVARRQILLYGISTLLYVYFYLSSFLSSVYVKSVKINYSSCSNGECYLPPQNSRNFFSRTETCNSHPLHPVPPTGIFTRCCCWIGGTVRIPPVVLWSQYSQPGHNMTTLSQQQEFEAAIQLHIQQAVAADLAGLPPPTAPAPPTVNVNAVAVKLPEFWPADPTTWFHQAEAAFRRSNVTQSFTKYDHVLMKLPKDVIMSVRVYTIITASPAPSCFFQMPSRHCRPALYYNTDAVPVRPPRPLRGSAEAVHSQPRPPLAA